jgi:hypothetical protein
LKGVNLEMLTAILDFMYYGEVSVTEVLRPSDKIKVYGRGAAVAQRLSDEMRK